MSTWNNGSPLTVSSNYLISNLVKLVNISVTRFSKETKEYAIEQADEARVCNENW